ncbi:hypothetical protein ACFFIX_20540 [Metabacillus herbersteinensis]|uniref:SAF domain-containing protein n=1 Tax=Metabacillus herbersteinensis TaxID=283816 RepID=A0ABV6GJM8_9BACI
MKPRTKITLGILTALTVMLFIPIYDLFIKDKIDSIEVVVVKPGKTIEKNEEITEAKLAVERRQKQSLIGDVIYAKEISEILGREASQVMVSNSMVSKKMIDYDLIVPNESEGEAIRPIVSDMIFAKPGSLRRKDTIDIYLISKDLIGNYTDTQATDSPSSAAPNEVSSKQKPKVSPSMLKEPLLKNVKVVYAKDSSNREVTNDSEEDAKNKNERLNATGNISDLEIILNEEDFQRLMNEVIQNENKMYITYN